MGGSKPSQFWMKEPPATDRKWRVEDAGIMEREKQEFAGSEAEQSSMIPRQHRKPQNKVRAKPAAKKAAPRKRKSASRKTARKKTAGRKTARKSSSRKSATRTSTRKRGKSRR